MTPKPGLFSSAPLSARLKLFFDPIRAALTMLTVLTVLSVFASRTQTKRFAAQVDFRFRPILTSRRSASDRDGVSGCLPAHASISSLSAGESRIGIVSPKLRPAGRPLFLCTLFSCFAMIIRVRKNAGRRRGGNLVTDPNPSHGGDPWLRLPVLLRPFAS